MMLADVVGVSGGTTQRISDYEVMGYFVDTQELVAALPVIWKQFKAAMRRVKDLSECTLSISAHIGTVYVEEFAAGERRKFETSGETVDFVKTLGQYVPEDQIWVTNSALVSAQKTGIVAAYHRVPGAVPGAPNEGVFEWRSPEMAAPVPVAAKARSRSASPAETLGRFAKVLAYVAVIALAVFGAASLIQQTLNKPNAATSNGKAKAGGKKNVSGKSATGKGSAKKKTGGVSAQPTNRNNRQRRVARPQSTKSVKSVAQEKVQPKVDAPVNSVRAPVVEPFPETVPPIEPTRTPVKKPVTTDASPAGDSMPGG